MRYILLPPWLVVTASDPSSVTQKQSTTQIAREVHHHYYLAASYGNNNHAYGTRQRYRENHDWREHRWRLLVFLLIVVTVLAIVAYKLRDTYIAP